MKNLVLSILLLFTTYFVATSQVSQNADSIHIIDTIFYPNVPESNIRYNYETMPEFPGGEDSLLAFAKRNLKYPQNLIKDSIEGRIVIRFCVDVNGIAGEVGFIKALHPELEIECTEMVNRFPRFKPGYMLTKSKKGRWYWRPTKVWYSLPVYFTTTNKHPNNIKLVITP